jgi:hypothetical protein
MTRRPDLAVACAAAAGALVASGAALAVAWATVFTACLDSTASDACGRKDLATVQFVLACVGFLPMFALIGAVWVGRTRLVWLAVASAIVLYALWALLNDAATHSWNDLRLLPD